MKNFLFNGHYCGIYPPTIATVDVAAATMIERTSALNHVTLHVYHFLSHTKLSVVSKATKQT